MASESDYIDVDTSTVDANIQIANVLDTQSTGVTPDQSDGKYADTTAGVNDYYTVQSRFYYDSGKRVLRGGAPGDVGKTVTLSAASCWLELKWVVSRQGGPPTIPNPVPSDPNAVLAECLYVLDSVDYPGDGVSAVYRASGKFVWEFLDPSKVNMTLPIPPWVNFGAAQADAQMALTLISGTILDTVGAAGIVNPFYQQQSLQGGQPFPGSGPAPPGP